MLSSGGGVGAGYCIDEEIRMRTATRTTLCKPCELHQQHRKLHQTRRLQCTSLHTKPGGGEDPFLKYPEVGFVHAVRDADVKYGVECCLYVDCSILSGNTYGAIFDSPCIL